MYSSSWCCQPSFDIVMSPGGELAQAAWEMETVHSGTSTKSLEGDSVADASKVA